MTVVSPSLYGISIEQGKHNNILGNWTIVSPRMAAVVLTDSTSNRIGIHPQRVNVRGMFSITKAKARNVVFEAQSQENALGCVWELDDCKQGAVVESGSNSNKLWPAGSTLYVRNMESFLLRFSGSENSLGAEWNKGAEWDKEPSTVITASFVSSSFPAILIDGDSNRLGSSTLPVTIGLDSPQTAISIVGDFNVLMLNMTVRDPIQYGIHIQGKRNTLAKTTKVTIASPKLAALMVRGDNNQIEGQWMIVEPMSSAVQLKNSHDTLLNISAIIKGATEPELLFYNSFPKLITGVWRFEWNRTRHEVKADFIPAS